MFSGVGFSSHFLYSLCWFLICRLHLGVHHGFRRGLGFLSYFSMAVWIACWISWSCWAVDVFGVWASSIADRISVAIFVLCFS